MHRFKDTSLTIILWDDYSFTNFLWTTTDLINWNSAWTNGHDYTEKHFLFTIDEIQKVKNYNVRIKFTVSKCKGSIKKWDFVKFHRCQHKLANLIQSMYCPGIGLRPIPTRPGWILSTFVSELDLDGGRDDGTGDLAPVLLPDLRQLLLHEPIQHPVLLPDVVSHDGLESDKHWLENLEAKLSLKQFNLFFHLLPSLNKERFKKSLTSP